jgi:hypothetical protein
MFNKTSTPDYMFDKVPEEIWNEMKRETVWYCEKDGAVSVELEAPKCFWCDTLMKDIGWMESHEEM